MSGEPLMTLVFAVVVPVILVVDLGLHRGGRPVGFREALAWSAVWIAAALAFDLGILRTAGPEKAAEFLTGYVIEKSLSVDNLFVFIVIFNYFGVPAAHQPKVLKWGIVGALVLRAVFIFAGLEALKAFSWLMYGFGVLLIVTGAKLAFSGGEETVEPEKNLLVRLARRFLPVTRRSHGDRFFVRRMGLLAATPLFMTLLVVESSDVLFAIDSIPAIFAVTRDPFIVYTSNVFAILGLRALYFLLARVMEMFATLRLGVCFVLVFVGVKMLVAETRFRFSTEFSMGVILGALVLSVLTSIAVRRLGSGRGRLSGQG